MPYLDNEDANFYIIKGGSSSESVEQSGMDIVEEFEVNSCQEALKDVVDGLKHYFEYDEDDNNVVFKIGTHLFPGLLNTISDIVSESNNDN